VVWKAALGANPIISGAVQVKNWKPISGGNIWSAPVPANTNSRQLYINGVQASIASSTPSALGFLGNWTGSSTGYNLNNDDVAKKCLQALVQPKLKMLSLSTPLEMEIGRNQVAGLLVIPEVS